MGCCSVADATAGAAGGLGGASTVVVIATFISRARGPEVAVVGSFAVDSPEIDIEAYAMLSARLSGEDVDRDAILAQHGLDELRWSMIEDHWQALLSAAMDVDVEIHGVPEILSRYSAAYARAQEEDRPSSVLSIDHFAEATRRISRSHDVQKTLTEMGLTLPQFLKANLHWTKRMLESPELAERFRKVLLGEK
jgi:hypothetical protein